MALREAASRPLRIAAAADARDSPEARDCVDARCPAEPAAPTDPADPVARAATRVIGTGTGTVASRVARRDDDAVDAVDDSVDVRRETAGAGTAGATTGVVAVVAGGALATGAERWRPW